MGNNDLFQKVRELKLSMGRYVLFGSAPMCIRDLRICNDLDVIVTEDIWHEYANKSGWQAGITPHGSSCLLKDGVEMVKDWQPGIWNVDKLIKEADIIEGLPFVKLDYVLEWKRLNGREKDLEDIKIIEKFLRHR